MQWRARALCEPWVRSVKVRVGRPASEGLEGEEELGEVRVAHPEHRARVGLEATRPLAPLVHLWGRAARATQASESQAWGQGGSREGQGGRDKAGTRA